MLSPYAGLDSPISLQSWNHQLKVDSADDKRIKQFADFMTLQRRLHPELGASCENPTFISPPAGGRRREPRRRRHRRPTRRRRRRAGATGTTGALSAARPTMTE